MTGFIGRQNELEELKQLLKKNSTSLVVIKGRRRIGKSRLLEEFGKLFKNTFFFSGLPPTPETTNQSQKNEFAKQLSRQIHKSNFNIDDWGDLFWTLSQHTKKGSVLIVLDEISWMGSKDPDFLGKLKNSFDLYFKKNDKLILAICGSSSAWIEKNILSSTGFLGRESLVLTLEELPLKDCVEFWGSEKTRVSAHEKLKLLSVTGGVPRYLEHIQPHISAEANIQNMCFKTSGILFDEFEKIFSDLFAPKNGLYKNIVHFLSNGVSDQKSISEAIGLKISGDISDYLNDLIKSGFISRDYTWDIKNGELSSLSHYRLKDNYSRFYLKYILHNRAKIEAGNMKNMSLSSLKGWTTIMGLQVENLVLSNRDLIKNSLKIDPNEIICDNPYFQRKTEKKQGCQIDYLIQTKFNTLYLCEIKYSKNLIGPQVIDEMKEKIKQLSLPRHFSYRTVLIHVNGVSEALEESQYFSHILDLSEFLIHNTNFP